MMMSSPVLVAEDLHKSYGSVRALDGITVSVEAGEILCILGRNGAGKSTLVSIVSGLLTADSGRVEIAGRPVRPWDDTVRSIVGVAGQEAGVYPPLTVHETLMGVGRMHDLRRGELRRRVDEVSDALDLDELRAVRVHALSGGQRRRLHTALALIHHPRLVVLDEPTAGVDVQTRARLLEVVRGLAASGVAICYSTHYLQEVEDLDGRVAIIEQGEIIASGTCAQLIQGHGTGFAELSFAGAAPCLEWAGTRVEADDHGLVRVACAEPHTALPALLEQATRQRCVLDGVQIVRPSLEGVFLKLTGERYLVGSAGGR